MRRKNKIISIIFVMILLVSNIVYAEENVVEDVQEDSVDSDYIQIVDEAADDNFADDGVAGKPAIQDVSEDLKYYTNPETINPLKNTKVKVGGGGEFKNDLFTGAAIYSLLVEVPPGTNGLQPKISIQYNSHDALKYPNILGSGWSLTESYIERDYAPGVAPTKQVYQYKLVLDSTPYELVYVPSEDRFHTEVESFLYIKKSSFVYGGNTYTFWIVKTKDGTSYTFGNYDGASLTSGNAGQYGVYQYGYVKWYLVKVTDTFDNNIYYHYNYGTWISASDSADLYLTEILYNNDKSRKIRFDYGNSDRMDLKVYYHSDIELTKARRLQAIYVEAQNKAVRSYRFTYRYADDAALSYLTKIDVLGSNDKPEHILGFKYYDDAGGWESSNSYWIPGGLSFTRNVNKDNLHLLDAGLRVGDVNGDGLVDLISADGQTRRSSIWINTGNGWNQDSSWVFPRCNAGDVSGCFTLPPDKVVRINDNGVRLVDLNGDGKVDIFQAKQDWSSYITQTWINTGKGWREDASWIPPLCSTTRAFCASDKYGRDEGVRFVDLNRDGLTDIVVAETGAAGSWMNTGFGWVSGDSRLPSTTDLSAYDGRSLLEDVNGDGLMDVIENNAFVYLNPGGQMSWKNLGNAGNIIGSNGAVFLRHGEGNNGVNLRMVHNGDWATSIQYHDINNDGWLDVLYSTYSGYGASAVINRGRNDIVDSQKLGLPSCSDQDTNNQGCFAVRYGGRNQKSYWVDNGVRIVDVNGDGLLDIVKASSFGLAGGARTTTWLNNAQSPYLLKKITNGLGGTTEITYEKSTSFDNTGGNGIPDLPFNVWVVSSINENNNAIKHNVQSTTRYSYKDGKYDAGDREFRGFGYVEEKLPDSSIVGHTFYQDAGRKGREYQTEIFDVQGTRKNRDTYEWSLTYQNNVYMVNLHSEFHAVSYPDNSQNVEITYGYDKYGNVEERVTETSNYKDPNRVRVEQSSYVYNANKWILNKPFQIVQIDSNEDPLFGTSYSYDGLAYGDAPEKGALTKKELWLDKQEDPVITYSYDSYGNLIEERNANGASTRYIYGINDNTYTFPEKIVNALGQETQYAYDLGTGNVLSESDANGYVTSYQYDEFGRLVKEIKEYDSEQYPTTEYVYQLDGSTPESILIKKRENSGSSDTLDSEVFYDGFGRVIQSKNEGESSKYVVKDFYYDNLGRLSLETIPYYSNQEQLVQDNVKQGVAYAYDALGRIIKITNPDGTFKRIDYPSPWRIVVYSEGDSRIDYFKDIYDNIWEVIEYNGNEVYTTSYSYDAMGNLIKITDAKGNSLTYAYDTLGRKIQMRDSDMGTWNYAYDKQGNLITQKDGKGNVIQFEYDGLNRVMKKITPQGSTTYTYDTPIIGALNSVQTPEVITSYQYDRRLRPIQKTFIVGGKTFSMQMSYDAMDRTLTKILPSGEQIRYIYNPQGEVEKIQGSFNAINNLDYNEAGQATSIQYGNNLRTAKEYDLLYRLKRIATGSIQDLQYRYDGNSNIKEINNVVKGVRTLMDYDALNRLVHVSSQSSALEFNYNIDYQYDAIGNMLKMVYDKYTLLFNYRVHAPYLVTMIALPNIKADYNKNGCVDIDDFFEFARVFNTWSIGHDLTGEGFIDLNDFFKFSELYGKQEGCAGKSTKPVSQEMLTEVARCKKDTNEDTQVTTTTTLQPLTILTTTTLQPYVNVTTTTIPSSTTITLTASTTATTLQKTTASPTITTSTTTSTIIKQPVVTTTILVPITTNTLPATSTTTSITTTSTIASTTTSTSTSTTTTTLQQLNQEAQKPYKASDLDKNGCVDINDFHLFEGYFNTGDLRGNLDKDGDVDFDDFFFLADEYGGCGK